MCVRVYTYNSIIFYNRGALRETTRGVQLIKLDIRDAYLQFELVNETKQLLDTNKHNRLCFGPSPSCCSHFPEIGGQSGCRHSRCCSLSGRHHRPWADTCGTPRKPVKRSRGSRQLRSESTTVHVCFIHSRIVLPGLHHLEGRTG